MHKLILGIGGIVLLALAWFLLAPAKQAIVEEAPTASSTPTLEVQPDTAPKASVKTYTNETHHYSFEYPATWILDKERTVINAENFMPSIVSVHEPEGSQPKRFSVTINTVERTIKNNAVRTEKVMVGGVEATAYFFPDGYQCTETGDCSFFLIPIKRVAMWYELTAANDAKTLESYRDILSSFTFTD